MSFGVARARNYCRLDDNLRRIGMLGDETSNCGRRRLTWFNEGARHGRHRRGGKLREVVLVEIPVQYWQRIAQLRDRGNPLAPIAKFGDA